MNISQSPIIVWFREDLRLSDNAALHAAAQTQKPVIAFYALDTNPALRPLGGASLWWLSQSLKALAAELSREDIPLILRRGPATKLLVDLAKETKADSIVWNRRYDPGSIAADTETKSVLQAAGLEVASHAGHLLREPWTVTTKTGTPPKVFTPFWKAHQTGAWREPLPKPERIVAWQGSLPSERLEDWQLEPTSPNWAHEFPAHWTPGEAGAKAKLIAFLDENLMGYGQNRNRPDRPSTSRLSPHLRFGEISPAQIAHATAHACASRAGLDRDAEKFLSEVGWREFSYALLHQRPDLPRANFQSRFDAFPWRDDTQAFQRWTKGLTGFPIVDAGMRELWRTGYMHNRCG